ncbi:MAG: 23S rRNA (uracil(1939)-C(5))-methyltransferase RlmD [Tindallia sp. MSAO_Bac2]|nr:MAG: 23S rRNA (uracil(1939)-C(5))-methyltransferase RlmD [Tindallia sp. MSAO_Bac2]
MIKENKQCIVVIEDLTHQGEGVGKIEGFPLFIAGAVPGDKVKVKIIKLKKNFGLAELVKIIKPSEDRVSSICQYHNLCGGCQTLTLDYEAQLVFKEKRVKDALRRIGKIDTAIKPVLGMENPHRYRNKAQFPIGYSEDKLSIGFFQRGSHDIVSIDDCKIQHPFNSKVIDIIKNYIRANNVSIYNEKTGKGLLRHLITKIGFQTQEQMVILVINGDTMPNEEELAHTMTQTFPNLKSLVINTNTKKTNVIMGMNNRVVYGHNYITDTLCGLEFQISPHAFYQVNPVQTEVLYDQVVKLADLKGDETVLDLYCGIGTISLLLAQRAGKVIGVESVEAAVEDARINAENNQIVNTEFYAANAEKILPELASQSVKPEIIVVDPPRKGCDKEVLEAMVKLNPSKIIYVSCNPSTLARDLRFLEDNVYKTEMVQPVDLFPNTVHVEMVVLMSRVEK